MDPTSQAFFDEMYSRSSDPWGFATDPYERSRYEHIDALLGDDTFERAFEPGCSIGELTAMLAPRCRHLLAMDISPIALERARARCADLAHVELRQGRLPEGLPDGPFDLVVFSEIGYYLDRATLTDVVDGLAERSVPAGLMIAAHWTGTSADHVLSGHEVHEVLAAHPGFETVVFEERPGYLIGTWRRR
jgi:SAM-dependent methyltransferase